MLPPRFFLTGLAVLALCGGCRRSEVRVYLAPKDAPDEPAPAAAAAAAERSVPPAVEPVHPRIAWETPPGWTPADKGQVSAVNFNTPAEGGQATVNVTVLGSFAGREGMVINMWRNQVGAAPLSDAEAAAALSEVTVAGTPGKLFEVNGARDGKPNRIVTAMLNRPDGTWFFKLAGDEPAVLAQKPAFLAFLKTFHFEGQDAPAHP